MIYTKGITEREFGSNGGALWWKFCGVAYEILAIREGDEAANQFMAENPGTAVLATVGDSAVICRATDLGVPFRGRDN